MEGKKVEYRILRHNMADAGDFGSQVSALLDDGFELHGDPLMSADGKIFAQAIVRYTDKTKKTQFGFEPVERQRGL